MKQRTAKEGFYKHKLIPVRNYTDDPIQQDRIFRSKLYVRDALMCIEKPEAIVELGCGTADISSAFVNMVEVIGVDANQGALTEANYRGVKTCYFDITKMPPFPADVLILCEVLEHLESPLQLVKDWLPFAQYSVISHPLNEALDSDISAGEHQWSYDLDDFFNWFKEGGHSLVKYETFQMGLYTIVIGLGRNNNALVKN